MPAPPSRKLTVIAQDPGVRRSGKIVTAEIELPNEAISAGPRGYRVHVIDYDPGNDRVYKPVAASRYGTVERPRDPFPKVTLKTIQNPQFHAQNVYAIVMRTLSRFESVLGRRIAWGFGSHQLHIAPHGIADANAYYSRADRALVFGHFRDADTGKPVFSCLSHDVVVHETTHALLDGLRRHFMSPSGPDQAAFHEGYADVIALLSCFSMPEVVSAALGGPGGNATIAIEQLTVEVVKQSILAGLGEQMGSALSGLRGNPLRRSLSIRPSRKLYRDKRYQEEHRRGELLVAAVMHAFLRVWEKRMNTLGTKLGSGGLALGGIDAERVASEAAAIAGRLLKIMIRAIDYTPPVHLRFGDFLSAALTADHELVPDDSEFGFRRHLRQSFASFGIRPASTRKSPEPGLWRPPEKTKPINYQQTRLESLRHDPNEVFRFLWENRKALNLSQDAHTEVLSVRPCRRVGPDGFILQETVAEYRQILTRHDGSDPLPVGAGIENGSETNELPGTYRVYGGGTLVFDEFGILKFHITNRVHDRARQQQRFRWQKSVDVAPAVWRRDFESLHTRRMALLPKGPETKK